MLAGGGGGADISFEGGAGNDDKVAELEAMLAKNQEAMDDMQSDWQKKLEEARK